MTQTIRGDRSQALSILESIRTGRALFVLVLSYTRTSEIPGITIAGADPRSIKYTPPADAEYIEYGHCRCIPGIPVTPDGKPTPAIMTRTAVRAAGIPVMVVDAGGLIRPQMPHLATGLSPGRNIAESAAMEPDQAREAVRYGRMVAGTLSSVCDCLIVGESVPGGTTTALAAMRGLNLPAAVSSTMPENPLPLKEGVVRAALGRLSMDDPLSVISKTADPMIPFVAGLLGAAAGPSKVVLAGGTQMLAVLALSSKLGFDHRSAAIGTTSYVADDPAVRFAEQAQTISPVPVISVDPGLDRSGYAGLASYADGFAKEGAGAGGALISAMARTGMTQDEMLRLIDGEYARITSR